MMLERRAHPQALPLVCLAALVSCGRGGEVRAAGPVVDPPPNVVLVTIDTLRADHLGCYGYFRDTTPVLDALAEESVLYEHAAATMGTTLPSHLSILTGLYPHQHGLLANKAAIEHPYRPSEGRRSAAELLGEAGYHTAAFVSGPTVGSITGIHAGFDVFDEPLRPGDPDGAAGSRPADETNAAVLAWLEEGPPEPYFLWVHYWDPHAPNRPVEPYASMFQADAELEALVAERRVRPDVLSEVQGDLTLVRLFAPEDVQAFRDGEDVEVPVLDDADLLELYDLYDGDIRYTDEHLGVVLDALDLDRCVLGVTSDHGQALGEHDWLTHGVLRESVTHVPLLLRFPPGVTAQPARVPDVVSTIDVLPTLLGRIDRDEARAFLDQAEGVDLLAGIPPRGHAFSQRTAVVKNWGPHETRDGLKFALTLDGWKYYHRTSGEDELFDLTTDPGELRDLAEDERSRVEHLRETVQRILRTRPHLDAPAAGEELDPARAHFEQTLGALGYLGDD